jgi:hypothetical protein
MSFKGTVGDRWFRLSSGVQSSPMKRYEIATAVIAVYGAVLSTVAIVSQLIKDRVKVKLTVRRDMEIVGDDRYHGMILTALDVTNVGHRPVTITTIAAQRLYPNKHFITVDNRPQLPNEITEGKYITTIVDETNIDFSTIDCWAAWDSHGRMFRLQQASWLQHWKSEFQRRRAQRQKAAGSSSAK